VFLVQLLLPRYDNDGQPFDGRLFGVVRQELIAQFGGVTAYTRAPARGAWEDDGDVVRDDILIYEVMVEELDRRWWAEYRETLRRRFDQDELIARAMRIELL
jgi:hypothetical protein